MIQNHNKRGRKDAKNAVPLCSPTARLGVDSFPRSKGATRRCTGTISSKFPNEGDGIWKKVGSPSVWREVCVCVGQPILVAQTEGANVHLWHLQNAFNHQITTKWILINDDYTQIYIFWHFTDTPSILVLSQFLILFFQRSNVSLSLELSEKWKHLIWPRLYRRMRQNIEIHFATWMAKRALIQH